MTESVTADGAAIFAEDTTFEDLGLRDGVLKGIEAAGFEHPTTIQAQLIPPVMGGKDVLGQAKTGTGKTAAFGLPLLQLAEPGRRFQALVLAPTRELAIQITAEIEELGRFTPIRAAAVYGGQPIKTQAARLAKGPEIIVGTPGRVMDMVGRGHLSLTELRFAVLDEVDRMFDIGFRDDIRRILSMCSKAKQTVFVSATISPEIERLARQHMTDPEKIVTSSGSLTVSLVEQHYLTVNSWDKRQLLLHLLTHEEPDLTLVFCRLKRSVDSITRYLERKGVDVHAIHGDLSQGKRNEVMRTLRKGELHVVIASDLAARGIDVEGISHVVNYDLPEDPDLYVHRIGRTARAGRRGVAWSFVTPEEGKLLTQIELLINADIPKLDYPDFKATEQPADWKPDKPSQHYVVEGVNRETKKRWEVDEAPEILGDPSKMAEKFPGGIVPSKRPPKRMQGRVRTRRK